MLGACTKEDLVSENHSDDMKEYMEVLKEANDKLMRLNSVQKQSKKDSGQLPKPKYPTINDMRDELKKLTLHYGSNEVFPSISAGAGFRYEAKAGRYFVAEREFKTGKATIGPKKIGHLLQCLLSNSPGDVVLMEPFFVNVLNELCLNTNCYTCLIWTDMPFPCSKCASVSSSTYWLF